MFRLLKLIIGSVCCSNDIHCSDYVFLFLAVHR